MRSKLATLARAGIKICDFPLFDCHAHVGKWAGFSSYDADDQIAEMDRIGVRYSVVSSLVALSGEIRRGNDAVAAAIKKHAGRLLGYVHVSANYPGEMLSEVQRCFAMKGFVGIKVYQTGVPYDDPRFEPVWEFSETRKLPILAHTWAGNLTGFDKAAKAHPGAAFIMGHAGSEWRHADYLDAAKRVENLYLDLTYSKDHAGLIEHFVKKAGADRIVWGSDVPLFSLAQQAGKVLFARISDADKKKILHDNGIRLFGTGNQLKSR